MDQAKTRSSALPRNELVPPASWAPHITRYLTYLASARVPVATRKLRSYYLRRFAVDFGGDPWTVEIDDLLYYVENRDWSQSALKAFRSTMRQFFTWAKERRLTKHNPAMNVPSIRSIRGLPRPASDDSLEAAFERADDREYIMLRLASEVGMRCREIAIVHSRDLDREMIDGRTTWALRIHGKGDRDRLNPLPDDLADILRSFDGYVFPGQVAGHLSASYVSKLLSRLLPGATAHQLRHRFATRAYQLGGRDIRAVQELLGHASVATTQIYTGVEREALRKAMLAAA